MARHILKELIADPSPFGLFAFATITFVSGLVHCGIFNPERVDRAMYGPAIWYGGGAQVIAGLLDLLRGEKVGGSTFLAFGLMWISMGVSKDASLGLGIDPAAKDCIIGFYHLGFFLIACATIIGMWYTTMVHRVLLGLVIYDFFALGLIDVLKAAEIIVENDTFETVTGGVLIATAALAYYLASALLVEDNLHLPIGRMNGNPKRKVQEEEARVAKRNGSYSSADRDV